MVTHPAITELTAETFDRLTGQGDNRRKRDRRPYRVLQWAAPCPEAGLPKPKAYRQIRCDDISRAGVSYFTNQPPLHEFLIIGLGTGAATIYVECRVANCVRVDQPGGAFRIGCEFVKRVELSPTDQPCMAR